MFVWRHGKWQPFFFLPKMPNKHHRMRNELVLSAKSAEHSAFSLWLNSENALFSMVMESSINNLQMLLMGHACLSFSALICASCVSVVPALLCLPWFATSLYLCRKGGLR